VQPVVLRVKAELSLVLFSWGDSEPPMSCRPDIKKLGTTPFNLKPFYNRSKERAVSWRVTFQGLLHQVFRQFPVCKNTKGTLHHQPESVNSIVGREVSSEIEVDSLRKSLALFRDHPFDSIFI
jgi:hypothetical protein